MASFIRTSDHLTVVFDNGESVTVYPSNPQYANIVAALVAKDLDKVRALASPVKIVEEKVNTVAKRDGTNVELRDGVVYYNGEALHNTLTDRIVQMSLEGFDVRPMILFLTNLQQNPSFRAVTELYSFLEKGNLPITEDGYFLAYKKVRSDYKDCHTGSIDNSVGQIVEMPRNKVNEDPNQTCSSGLHFCSRDYLSQFGGDHTMILKINPADVVAIPTDYNDSKGRTCRYVVVGEVQNDEKLEGAFRPSDDYVEPPDYSESDDEDYDDDDGYGDDYDWDDEDDADDAEFDDVGGVDVLLQEDAQGNIVLASDDNTVVVGVEIEKIDPNDGEVMAVYENLDDASYDTGINKAAIARVLRGDRNTTGGYAWKYTSTVDPTAPHTGNLAALHENGTLYGGKSHS